MRPLLFDFTGADPNILVHQVLGSTQYHAASASLGLKRPVVFRGEIWRCEQWCALRHLGRGWRHMCE